MPESVLLVDSLGFAARGHDSFTPSVLRLRGSEGISRPYAYEIDLATSAHEALGAEDVASLLTAPARVWFGRRDDVATVHGVLRSVTVLAAGDASAITHRVVLVPRLARLELTCRSRVFHSMSYPAIVRAILREHGFEEDRDFELRLVRGPRPSNEVLPDPGPADDDFAEYAQREYTVQYEESDLSFVQRLLEHEGIFYWFAQDDDREKLVIGDRNTHFPALAGLVYEARNTHDRADVVSSMARENRIGSARVELRDYNWRTPSVSMTGAADADRTTGFGTWCAYGDHFRTPQEGDRYARVRAEERLGERELYQGSATSPFVVAGCKVPIERFAIPDLDREYLVTSVERLLERRETENQAAFHVRFEAVRAETPFRPRRVTPKPRVDGIMHARVDGEVRGMTAPIDEHGRYKVALPYDGATHPTGKASRWIRMAQPSSGEGYGMHFPLHVGIEVMLAHVGGDPDRPVIVGSVPNSSTVTPVTSANPTQSQVRTRSGIVMEFEDDA